MERTSEIQTSPSIKTSSLCDTEYGWFEEQKKRDVEQAYQKMSAAQKEVFIPKMVEIDEANAGDGETPPLTPTPI